MTEDHYYIVILVLLFVLQFQIGWFYGKVAMRRKYEDRILDLMDENSEIHHRLMEWDGKLTQLVPTPKGWEDLREMSEDGITGPLADKFIAASDEELDEGKRYALRWRKTPGGFMVLLVVRDVDFGLYAKGKGVEE